MKVSNTVRSALSLVVQVLVPAIMVVGVRAITLRDGPAAASAAPPEDTAVVSPGNIEGDDFALGAKDLEQLQQARLITGEPIQRDPFASSALQPEDVALARILPVPGEALPAETAAPQAPPVQLTSIVTGRETVAVINSRVSRVGDAIDGEWKLVEIDAAKNTVVIEHTTGLRATFTLSR